MCTVWQTLDGRMLPFHAMDDYHLVNLFHYIRLTQGAKVAEATAILEDENTSPDYLFIAEMLKRDAQAMIDEITAEYDKRGFYRG